MCTSIPLTAVSPHCRRFGFRPPLFIWGATALQPVHMLYTHSTSCALQVTEEEAGQGAAVSKKLLPRFPSLERLRLRSQRASLDSPRSLPSQPPRQQQLGFDAAEAGPGSAAWDSSSGQSSPRLAASHQGHHGPAQSLGGRSHLSSRLSSLTVDLRRADLSGESGAPGSSARPSSERPRCAADSPGLLDRSVSRQNAPAAAHQHPSAAASLFGAWHPSGSAAAVEASGSGLGMQLAAGLGAAERSPQGPALPAAADMQLSGTAGGSSGVISQPAAGHVTNIAARLQSSRGADASPWGDAQPAAAPAAAVWPQPELRAVWTGSPAEGATAAAAGGSCLDGAAQQAQLQPVQRPMWTHGGWRTRVPRCKRGRHGHRQGAQDASMAAAGGPAGVAPAAPPVVSQPPC